jgi:hypothetical protein
MFLAVSRPVLEGFSLKFIPLPLHTCATSDQILVAVDHYIRTLC